MELDRWMRFRDYKPTKTTLCMWAAFTNIHTKARHEWRCQNRCDGRLRGAQWYEKKTVNATHYALRGT